MNKKLIIAGAALVLAFGAAPAQAGIDLNEVSAFLAFPGVAALAAGPNVETFLTITNTSSQSYIAHLAFINGDENDPKYCYECNYDIPMSGFDTETLVMTRQNNKTHIVNLDTGASRTCDQFIGFVTVDLENSLHEVQTDNVLLGEEVVIDYSNGAAFSVPAISIQGDVGDNNRTFKFDGKEYRKFPSVIGGDFLAPDAEVPDGTNLLDAALVLFTLGFQRQLPPFTDCSITTFDAFEEQLSNSFTFGCWTAVYLEDVEPEAAYPYLGVAFDNQEHGWFQLSCEVAGTGPANGVITGGVHGLIAQYAKTNAVLRREAGGPALGGAAAWARVLYQSGTVGSDMTLYLGNGVTGF